MIDIIKSADSYLAIPLHKLDVQAYIDIDRNHSIENNSYLNSIPVELYLLFLAF